MISFVNIKNITSLSIWYRIAVGIVFLIYVAAWSWTIWFSGVQQDSNITPILPVTHVADSAEYANLADSMIQGEGFSLKQGMPEYFRTPGYPVMIYVVQQIFGSLFAVTFLQILLAFGIALIIRSIGTQLFSKVTGEISSLLFLINPYVLVVTLSILTDILFIFLFILGIFLALFYLEKYGYKMVILVSLIFAIAIYIRPVGLFALPVFLAPVIILKLPLRKKISMAALMIVMIFLFMAPWMMRNQNQSGVFSFTSLKSYNLVSYNIPLFLSLKNGSGIAAESNEAENSVGVPREFWRDLAHSKKLDDYAISAIKADPLGYFKFHTISTLPFFFSSPFTAFVESWYGTILKKSAPSPKAAIFLLTQGDVIGFIKVLLSNGWYFVFKLLSGVILLLALYAAYRHRRIPAIWAFLFIIGYMALLAGPVSNIRYRLPVEPFIFILAIAGILELISRASMIRKRRINP